MTTAEPAGDDVAGLNRVLVAALLSLARAGAAEAACRLAARGWSLLRHGHAREAERLSAALHVLARQELSVPYNQGDLPMSDSPILDVRTLVPAERHRRIFATYEGLAPGEKFILVNDHDPKPLYYQFDAEHSGQFLWRYLMQGPDVWRVEIGRTGAASRGAR